MEVFNKNILIRYNYVILVLELIMVISMSMAGLTGCKMAKDNIGNKIEDNLKVELGEDFNVFRLQGSNFDTEYQAYVSPVSNPEIRFSVNAEKYGKLKDFQKSSYYSANSHKVLILTDLVSQKNSWKKIKNRLTLCQK